MDTGFSDVSRDIKPKAALTCSSQTSPSASASTVDNRPSIPAVGKPKDIVKTVGKPKDMVKTVGKPKDIVKTVGKPKDIVMTVGKPQDIVMTVGKTKGHRDDGR